MQNHTFRGYTRVAARLDGELKALPFRWETKLLAALGFAAMMSGKVLPFRCGTLLLGGYASTAAEPVENKRHVGKAEPFRSSCGRSPRVVGTKPTPSLIGQARASDGVLAGVTTSVEGRY